MKPANESAATPLTAKRWQQMEVIFHQAVETQEPGRRELVHRLCAGDSELLANVQELLDSFDQQKKRPVSVPPSQLPSPAETRFGNFRLDRLLGQGGMSSVYMAHRDDGQFEQKVAVKLMSPHLASEFFTERFRRERQILADLNHANVTRLIDGGVSASGDPYLIMEYVDGTALDAFCDEHRLMISQRIQLFLEICSAVEYAHEQHIIHCDLKPGNILVRRDGTPKLLDFGTAKLLSGGRRDSTTTRFGMMTLRYASPEQLRGDPLTAATDVYSLGVVLYELVSGAWPFGNPQSVLAGLDRAVHDVKPAAVSQLMTDAAAEARSTTKSELARQAGGGLERVLTKAVQARPEDRYSSVKEFADDLRHFLEGAPVAAAPLSIWTGRQRRFALVVVPACLLLAAVAYFTWPRPGPQAGGSSIAVLPFVNASGNSRDQYIADGLTEDVTDELARNPSLRVIARASASHFAGKNPNVTAVSRALNVGTVLTGQVDHEANVVNVNAQLRRAPDGALLWSRTYHRNAADLAALYSELATAVSTSLQPGQSRTEARHVTNDEAYDLTLRAAYEIQQMTPASLGRAEQELRRAIAIDPQYARSYDLLGRVAWNISAARGNSLRTTEERKMAIESWQKALAVEPENRSARAMLAAFAMQYDWDWARAERELRHILASGPDAAAERMYAFWLLYQGQSSQAKIHFRRGEELDPISIEALTNAALFWGQAGEFERSLDVCRRLGKVPGATIMSSLDYVTEGRPEVALRLLEKFDDRLPYIVLTKAIALGSAGHREQALRLAHPFEASYPNLKVPCQWLALLYAYQGDEPNTVKWLQRSADAHEWQVLNIAVHPAYKKMQQNPDFQALKRRIGLIP